MRSIFIGTLLAGYACCAGAQVQSQEPAKKEGMWSKIKRITAEEVGNAVTVNGKPIGGQARAALPGGLEVKRIQNTPLHGIFMSDSAMNADYPHVAITITDYSDRIVSRGMNLTSRSMPNDCLFFNVTLWRSAKRSEQFDGLSYCAADGIKSFSRGAFEGGIRLGFTTNGNTGQRRTTGPLPPAMLYPRGSDDDRLLDGPGFALLGNILMSMGLDFSYGGNLGRVWVVSTNNLPGT